MGFHKTSMIVSGFYLKDAVGRTLKGTGVTNGEVLTSHTGHIGCDG